jgi:autotransporter translocation and assembly factor TamB
MRRVWKWTKRIVISTAAVVGLAIGVLLMIAHTDWGRDFIRRRAESALLENFPGGVRIGRITGSVFGTLVVEDVVINNRDGKPWITVGSAKV